MLRFLYDVAAQWKDMPQHRQRAYRIDEPKPASMADECLALISALMGLGRKGSGPERLSAEELREEHEFMLDELAMGKSPSAAAKRVATLFDRGWRAVLKRNLVVKRSESGKEITTLHLPRELDPVTMQPTPRRTVRRADCRKCGKPQAIVPLEQGRSWRCVECGGYAPRPSTGESEK